MERPQNLNNTSSNCKIQSSSVHVLKLAQNLDSIFGDPRRYKKEHAILFGLSTDV